MSGMRAARMAALCLALVALSGCARLGGVFPVPFRRTREMLLRLLPPLPGRSGLHCCRCFPRKASGN